MFYIKTPKTITVTGRKRILAVGTEVKKLGLDGGDDVVVYIMRPEDELSMDMLIEKTSSKFYLLFSENPDLIVARTLIKTRRIKDTKPCVCYSNSPYLLKYLNKTNVRIYSMLTYPFISDEK